jgi:hypothetical protein
LTQLTHNCITIDSIASYNVSLDPELKDKLWVGEINLISRGITPENLPPDKDVKKLERKLNSDNKRS